MFKIEKISQETFDKAKKFLLTVPSISEVDDEILSKAILVLDNSNLVGCVSYEIFTDIGLIRYFVFKKVLSESLIKELFLELEKSASLDGINKIFCVVNNDNIENLFSSLDFKFVNRDIVFIDEQSFTDLEFGDSNIMMRELEQRVM